MTKLIEILTQPAVRAKAVRQLSVVGMVVGVVATVLVSTVALRGSL